MEKVINLKNKGKQAVSKRIGRVCPEGTDKRVPVFIIRVRY